MLWSDRAGCDPLTGRQSAGCGQQSESGYQALHGTWGARRDHSDWLLWCLQESGHLGLWAGAVGDRKTHIQQRWVWQDGIMNRKEIKLNWLAVTFFSWLSFKIVRMMIMMFGTLGSAVCVGDLIQYKLNQLRCLSWFPPLILDSQVS